MTFDPLLRSFWEPPRIMLQSMIRRVLTLLRRLNEKYISPPKQSRSQDCEDETNEERKPRPDSRDHALTTFDRPIYPIMLVEDEDKMGSWMEDWQVQRLEEQYH